MQLKCRIPEQVGQKILKHAREEFLQLWVLVDGKSAVFQEPPFHEELFLGNPGSLRPRRIEIGMVSSALFLAVIIS